MTIAYHILQAEILATKSFTPFGFLGDLANVI